MLLPWPRKVYNVDGTENKAGVIERLVKLHIQQGDKDKVQTFFITNLGDVKVRQDLVLDVSKSGSISQD
jgi:hypothetical protein